MSYKLDKPYTSDKYFDFVSEYNAIQGLLIEETEKAVYALEKNEIIIDGEPQIDPNYEIKQAELQKQLRLKELKEQLEELDRKRIRAVCEPSMKTEHQTWLEYYNEQIAQIRQVMAEL